MTDFAPPPIRPALLAALQRCGWLDPAAIDWMDALIEPLWQAGQPGHKMIRAVLDAPQFDAAVVKRKRDVDEALELVVHRAMMDTYRARDLAQIARLPPGYGVRISAVLDDASCAAARRLHGKVFARDKVPVLPKGSCRYCRCGYQAHPLEGAASRQRLIRRSAPPVTARPTKAGIIILVIILAIILAIIAGVVIGIGALAKLTRG